MSEYRKDNNKSFVGFAFLPPKPRGFFCKIYFYKLLKYNLYCYICIMLEVSSSYKNYPLRGVLNYDELEGYDIFLEYELAGFRNKRIILKNFRILEFLQEQESSFVQKEEYELADIMLKFRNELINKLNDYQ